MAFSCVTLERSIPLMSHRIENTRSILIDIIEKIVAIALKIYLLTKKYKQSFDVRF